jgi:hypothetical protein
MSVTTLAICPIELYNCYEPYLDALDQTTGAQVIPNWI